MYEFKHAQSGSSVLRSTFAYRRLEELAVVRFYECPKLLTLALHTSMVETTPIHCYKAGDGGVCNYWVPKQALHSRVNHEGIRCSLLLVISEQGRSFWLVVSDWNRQGFLLPHYVINLHIKPCPPPSKYE